MWELALHTYKTVILGDKGYIGDSLAISLTEKENITLLALKRNNTKDSYPKDRRNWISKHRRYIETTFLQLIEQFSINEVLVRSVSGLVSRINSKILGHNLYFINRRLGRNAINEAGQIKYSI